MGSSYFGEPNLGNVRSGSSRKGKKNNSDKPRQPQRGLGVAQLEQIRLSNEMGSSSPPTLHNPSYTGLDQKHVAAEVAFSSSSSSYSPPSSFGLHPNVMMGEMELTNRKYGESPSSGTTRIEWNYNNSTLKTQQATQFCVTRQFLAPPMENASQKKRINAAYESMGSGSQYSNSSDEQELDLDLKL